MLEMDLLQSEDELMQLTPPEIRDQARDVEFNLLPEKSRTIYELTYSRFKLLLGRLPSNELFLPRQ